MRNRTNLVRAVRKIHARTTHAGFIKALEFLDRLGDRADCHAKIQMTMGSREERRMRMWRCGQAAARRSDALLVHTILVRSHSFGGLFSNIVENSGGAVRLAGGMGAER